MRAWQEDDRYMYSQTIQRRSQASFEQAEVIEHVVGMAVGWKHMAISMMVVNVMLVLIAGGVLMASQISSDHVVDAESYRPERMRVMASLADFVRNARSVSLDATVLSNRQAKAMGLASVRGRRLLERSRSFKDSIEVFGRGETRTVDVESLILLDAGHNRWRVDWTERTRCDDCLEEQVQRSAEFEVLVRAPVGGAEFEANPHGVWVDAFDWRLFGAQ